MRRPLLTFLLLALSAAAAACGDDESGQSSLPFGALYARSGPLSFTFTPAIGALDVARSEVNNAGGVLGQPMEFLQRDSQFGLEESDPAARIAELSAAGAEVTFGAVASGSTGAAIPAAVNAEMVLINHASGSPALTAIEDNDLFFRTLPPQGNLGLAAAEYLVDQGLATVTILQRSPDPTLDAFGGIYLAAAQTAGLTVNADTGMDSEGMEIDIPIKYTFEDGDGLGSEVAGLLEDLYTDLPDALIVLDFQPGGAALLDQLDRGRFPGLILVFNAMAVPQMVTLVGASQMEGIESVSIRVAAGPAFDRFSAAFTALNGTDVDFVPTLQTSGYDAVALAALATEAAGSYDARAIANELRNVGNPPGVVVENGDLARGLELVRQGMDVDYEGVGSNGDLNSDGELSDDLALYRFESGSLNEIRALVEGVDY